MVVSVSPIHVYHRKWHLEFFFTCSIEFVHSSRTMTLRFDWNEKFVRNRRRSGGSESRDFSLVNRKSHKNTYQNYIISNKLTATFPFSIYFEILNMLTSYVFHIIIDIHVHSYSVNEFHCRVTYCVIFGCLSDFLECFISIQSNSTQASPLLPSLPTRVSESANLLRSKGRIDVSQRRCLDVLILKKVLSRIISLPSLVGRFLHQWYNFTVSSLDMAASLSTLQKHEWQREQ